MAKFPKLPKGATTWGPEDQTPAALRRKGGELSGLVYPAEVFLNAERAQYWSRLDGWHVKEAALLWCGLDPLLLEKWSSNLRMSLEDACPVEVEPRVHALTVAGATKTLTVPAPPGAVLQWAAAKGWRFPDLLLKPDSYGAIATANKDKEAPGQRRARIRARRLVLEADGFGSVTARLAQEEGVSQVRVRQLLSEKLSVPKSKKPGTPFGGLGQR
jgi:hypothetical protein